MRALLVLPMVVASLFAGPPRFNVKIMIDASRATPSVHALAIIALQQGMYNDSVIVAAPPATNGEILADLNRTQTVVLRGRVAVKGDSATVCLAVYDLLLRPMTAPDRFNVAIAEFRDGLSAAGRRIAKQLADRNFPQGPAGQSCF